MPISTIPIPIPWLPMLLPTQQKPIITKEKHFFPFPETSGREWATLLSPRCFSRGLRPVPALNYVYTVAGFIVGLIPPSKRRHSLLPCEKGRPERDLYYWQTRQKSATNKSAGCFDATMRQVSRLCIQNTWYVNP